jgi:non-ribosomal peptide synthetase component F
VLRREEVLVATQEAPLSFAQESLWLTEEIVPGLTQYQMVVVFEIGGPLDRVLLERSVAETVRRHELLRSRFTRVDGSPRIVVGEVEGDLLGFVDLSTVPAGPAADGAVAAVVGRWYRQAIDLHAPPLLRGELVRLEPERHLLILATHHIVGDEQSIGVVQHELFTCYEAFAAGTEPELPELPVQYADWTTWQREQLEPELDDGLTYWAKRLADLPTMPLPVDHPRPAVRTFTCAWADVDLDPDAVDALQQLARDRGTSLFTVLLAAFDLLLARWTGAAEVVVGTPVAGRPEPELENLVGFFVNSVVLRTRCHPDEPFLDLLDRVKRDLAEDLAFDHVPFHRVVERINPPRGRNAHPLYQTAFHIAVPEGGDSGTLADLTVLDRSDEFLRASGVTSEFELVVQAIVAKDRPRAQLQYAVELFEPATMAELADQFGRLVTAIARDPTLPPPLPGFRARPAPVAAPPPGAAPPAAGPGRSVTGPVAVDPAEVLAIVAEELNLPHVDVGDDFFALGGSSLTGSRVVQRLRDEYGLAVTLIDLFDAETIGDLIAACGIPAGVPDRPGDAVPEPGGSRSPTPYPNARLCERYEQAGADAGVYHTSIGMRLTGVVDVPALRAAVADLARRHEPLRTTFARRDGATEAVARDPAASEPDFAVERVAAGRRDEAMTRAAAEPFDLRREPPWRVRLFESDDERFLLIVLHRVAADAWSTRPLLGDLTAAYTARVRGGPPDWAPLPLAYSDFVARHQQRCAAGTTAHAAQLDHWRTALAGLPTGSGLPTDRRLPPRPAYRADRVVFDVPAEAYAGLTGVADRHRANLFMVLQAAVAALLTAHGAGTDVPVGCTVAGRGDRDLDELVGAFANTLVLRIDTSGDPSFDDLVGRVRRVALAAFANQDVPFARLVDEIAPAPAAREQSLYQVSMSLCTEPVLTADLEMPGLRAELVESGPGLLAQELAFEFTELRSADSGQLWGVLEYATELFDRTTAQGMVDRLVTMLCEFGADPSRPVHG